MLQPSHICNMYTHIYIHVDGAWCVCGALPYSFSNGLVVHKPTRPLREIRVWIERGERLVPVDYTARPSRPFPLDVLMNE